MIAVIQRVSEAKVVIEGRSSGQIAHGLLVLLGIEEADNDEDVEWLSRKIINLRIFDDEDGVMNKCLLDVDGELLVVSQFTLHASTKKGNRPSYIKAARPEHAEPLYLDFVQELSVLTGNEVQKGVFGADMQVELCNDGPVTIIIDSKIKE